MSEDINTNGDKWWAELECINQSSNSFESVPPRNHIAKLHIPSTMCSIIQGEEFWPKFVTCRPWQQKNNVEKTAEHNTEINTAPVREYSTLV